MGGNILRVSGWGSVLSKFFASKTELNNKAMSTSSQKSSDLPETTMVTSYRFCGPVALHQMHQIL